MFWWFALCTLVGFIAGRISVIPIIREIVDESEEYISRLTHELNYLYDSHEDYND